MPHIPWAEAKNRYKIIGAPTRMTQDHTVNVWLT